MSNREQSPPGPSSGRFKRAAKSVLESLHIDTDPKVEPTQQELTDYIDEIKRSGPTVLPENAPRPQSQIEPELPFGDDNTPDNT